MCKKQKIPGTATLVEAVEAVEAFRIASTRNCLVTRAVEAVEAFRIASPGDSLVTEVFRLRMQR